MHQNDKTVPRLLTLCADDFGQSPAISAGIVRLAQLRRVTAISCLTNSPWWSACAESLRELPPTVGIGLHLNLTDGQPLSTELASIWPQLPSLAELILRAHLRLVPRAAIRSEINAQSAAFTRATGHAPAHIDGHQHVHHLPVVRDLLLGSLQELPTGTALRNTGSLVGPGFAIKRWLIRNSGGRRLQSRMRRDDVRHNTALLGAYDFNAVDYRAQMRGWLARLPCPGGLLFCHPGLDDHAGHGESDLIAAARVREFDYLCSADFTDDLLAANVVLDRDWR